MSPKVYEVESGKTKKGGFVLYPSWRCSRCHLMRRESIGRVCRACKEKEVKDGDQVEEKAKA